MELLCGTSNRRHCLWLVHALALAVFAALTVGFLHAGDCGPRGDHHPVLLPSSDRRIVWLGPGQRHAGDLPGWWGHRERHYSLDRWLATRKLDRPADPQPSVAANIAVRLIQLHMCVIYLFGGIGKMRGELWWDGSACWFAIANYEYQSFDLTWLVRYPFLIAFATHITVFWETFYPFLVWSRRTRPIALALAVMVHGGIALFLGMPTFGIAMIIGNLAFLLPKPSAASSIRCDQRNQRRHRLRHRADRQLPPAQLALIPFPRNTAAKLLHPITGSWPAIR